MALYFDCILSAELTKNALLQTVFFFGVCPLEKTNLIVLLFFLLFSSVTPTLRQESDVKALLLLRWFVWLSIQCMERISSF